jgi:hypothetical protein
VAAVIFAGNLFEDRYLFWDSYLDLAAGRVIAHDGIPHREVFTLAARGRPWIDQQWLGQWLYYEAYRLGGYPAVGALSAFCIAVAFGVLAGYMLHRGTSTVRTLIDPDAPGADYTHRGSLCSFEVLIEANGLDDPALALMGIWGIGAGIIINLAGLRGIPTELYEAATIDGAGWVAQLRNVTIPMISPVIFYTLILGIVDVLQYFLVPLVLNQGTGEPGGATNFLNLYIYKNFFTYQNMSYGATLAWLLFGITLLITVVLFWSSRRWVYYAGER